MKIKSIHCKLPVTILALFLCLSATTSCGQEIVKFEYDDLSQNLVRIELVNITIEKDPEYTMNIEVIKTLEEDMHETVLREIAAMDFYVLKFGTPNTMEGKGLIIYDDTFRLIITSKKIFKESLELVNEHYRELVPGELHYDISTDGAFEKLLSEIT